MTTPVSPKRPAPRNSRWVLPAFIIGVLLGALIGWGIAAVVGNARKEESPRPPSAFPASGAIMTAVEPTVEPSPSVSPTPPTGPEILATIQDSFAAYAEYSLVDGFQIPLDPHFVIVNVGEVATCGPFEIDGSYQFSYPTFWCSPNDTLYSSITSFRLIESQGFLTREAYLLNGWAVALTDAQNKTTVEYVACAFGTVARSDVEDEQITDGQAGAIRDHFFPQDSDSSRFTAFITGYNGKTKISCDVFG